MGRGRGGGGHRGRGRGRGGGGGRGGQRGKNRWEHKTNDKDASHLRQFGEIHPSQDMQDFGPSASKKFKPFERNHQNNNSRDKVANTSDTSESESEEEATPYNELLTLFSGQKKSKQVQIVSESEEDESSELGEEEEEEEEEEPINVGLSESNDPNSLVDDVESDEEDDNDDKDGSELSEEEENNELPEIDDDGIVELPEETVIAEAEIDPDAIGDNDSLDKIDPFLLHFERELPEHLRESLSSSKEKLYKVHSRGEFPILEQFQFSGMEDTRSSDQEEASTTHQMLAGPSEKRKLVQLPKLSIPTKSSCRIDNLHLKPQLVSRIGIANQQILDKENCGSPLTPFQSELLFVASQYHDLYFPGRTMDNQEAIRLAYCTHVANHVLKTRTRILHHNAKMASKIEVPDEYRDQGFVRPKVLILVPFKESALRIVKILISLILETEKGNVANKKRFVEEYSGDTLFMPKTNPKPEDYMSTFAGNVDDNFRLGLSVTKKTIKLFTDFYSSDIIIASPLGLRIIVGAEGEKDRDYDFLSSIEVAILDQADVFLMQSWDHVVHLMKHLNLQPITTHGTDFGRIRPWAVDGLARNYCQTLLFSNVNCPEHNALFSRHCKNFAGLIKIVNPIIKGSICQVTVQLPQVYQQFDTSSLQEMNDARFNYFTSKVLPNFTNRLMSQTLIFVSSYFDFVRLRNYFKREEMSFVQICEYTKDKKIARSRDLFFHNENHFLLYTERAMFFRRLRLKGIGHIIFYQLPQYPQLYSELCNSVQEAFQNRRVRQRKNASVTTIYCKYDASRLADIVGSDRASHMLSSDKKVHAFVTGELT